MKRHDKGFTFIELMVVLGALGALALLAFPMVEMAALRQKEATLKQALLDIRQALDAYKEANDKALFQAGTESGYPSNLNELKNKRDQFGRFFLRTIPADPFYDGPVGLASETWIIRAYQSPPGAPQQGADVYDVFSSSTRIGSNGLAYSEW